MMTPKMMRKYSYILTLVAAAYALAACSSNEIRYPDELSADNAVGFSWYASRSASTTPRTKADPEYFVDASGETHLPVGKSFGVFGYFHPQYKSGGVTMAGGWNDGVNSNYPNLFYNEEVTIGKDASDNYTYDYTNSRYWPKNKYDRMSFIAYYPYNSVINESGKFNTSAIVESFLDSTYVRKGMIGFYYQVPEQASKQVDFMVSDLCMDQSKAVWNDDHTQALTCGPAPGSGRVKFFFHHALSQVRVKSVTFDKQGHDSLSLSINSIVFKNVAIFGRCIPTPDEDYYGSASSAHYSPSNVALGRVHVDPLWPADGLAAARGNGTTGVSAHVCYDAGTDTWDPDNYLLMIPHTFFSGAEVEVDFDVTMHNADTGEYYNYSHSKLSAPLTRTDLYEWQAGKIYTYNITLTLNRIDVTATIEPWLLREDEVMME